MSLPTIILGFVISTLYGTLFHLWRDGGAGRLLLYLILAWVGFWIGYILAAWLGWTFLSIGSLHLGTATIGSLVFLVIGHWLSLVETEKKLGP